MWSKTFSSYGTVFELTEGLQVSNTSVVDCTFEVILQKKKKALATCYEKVNASFLCVLKWCSALGRFT